MNSPVSSNQPLEQVLETQPVDEILTAYTAGVQSLRLALGGMTPEQIRAVPVPGTWSTQQVICHISDFDIVYAERIQRVLAEEQPPLRGGDPDQFAAGLRYAERHVWSELALMEALRQRQVGLLRGLPEEAWSRVGIHSSDGSLTLKTLLVRVTNHIPHHLRFLMEKRRALGLSAWPDETTKTGTRPQHVATVRWIGGESGFTRGHYSREHTWTFDGGVTIPASPSPHVVPAPWSSEAAVDPEEGFVASVASCHMLTFLWLASKAGYVVTRYEDRAWGVMTKNQDRIPWVSRMTLNPVIDWGGDRRPSGQEIAMLHEQAHHQCFIANSIRTEVVVNTESQELGSGS